jgi:hypothetical protein
MTGVTIGTGSFRNLADKAADSFRRTTGLPCVVLGDEHLAQYDLPFPHHLKYYIFDIVQSECVFYFDSDLWWMREWNPRLLAEKTMGGLGAVRDLNRSGHISMDAEGFNLELDKYFNSGFLVLHREPCRYLLSAAKGCYERIIDKLDPKTIKLKHPKARFWVQFKDQTSLNMAAQMMRLPIHYIDRRYNWVQSSGDWMDKGMPVIGAHKIGRDMKTTRKSLRKDFSTEISDNFEIFARSENSRSYVTVAEEEFERLSGTYTYTRDLGPKGKIAATVILRPDGTIQDSGLLEQWWFPIQRAHGIALWATGHTAACWKEYLTFKAQLSPAGDLWQGRWEHFEKSDITLQRVET